MRCQTRRVNFQRINVGNWPEQSRYFKLASLRLGLGPADLRHRKTQPAQVGGDRKLGRFAFDQVHREPSPTFAAHGIGGQCNIEAFQRLCVQRDIRPYTAGSPRFAKGLGPFTVKTHPIKLPLPLDFKAGVGRIQGQHIGAQRPTFDQAIAFKVGQRAVDVKNRKFRVGPFLHRKRQGPGHVSHSINDIDGQISLIHCVKRWPVQQRQDRGDFSLGLKPDNAGGAILDRDIGHYKGRSVHRYRRRVRRRDGAAVHTHHKAVCRQARMTAARRNIWHRTQKTYLRPLKIKVEIGLGCLTRLQPKSKIDIAQRASIDVLGHPFARLWFDVLRPKLQQAFGLQRVQSRIQRHLPPLRAGAQIARQVQGRIPVEYIHASDRHVERIESYFRIDVGTLDRHRRNVEIRRISDQVPQADLRHQLPQLAACVDAQRRVAFDPPRHPLAFDR